MNTPEALNSARQYHRAGNLLEAEKIYRRILQKEPNHPETLHLMGAIIGQRGDINGAIELMRRSVAIRDNDGEAHRNLGVLLAKQQRFEDALQSFTRSAELLPDSPQAHFDLGKIFTVLNRHEDAIQSLSRAVTLKPDFFEALMMLGDACVKIGDQDLALTVYSKSRQLKPQSAEVHNAIAGPLIKKGQFAEAIQASQRAIDLKPTLATAHFNLGIACRAVSRLEEAAAAFRGAIKASPGLYEAHASLAILLALMQRFDDAHSVYAEAARLQPDSARTSEVMGMILLRQKGSAASIEHFRRATEIDPNLLSAWNSLGLALQSQGKFDEAALCFRQMLQIRPNLAIAHKHLVASSRQKASHEQIQPLMDLLNQPDLSPEQRITAAFALGTALDDAERYDEAFTFFAQANALVRANRASVGERYDREVFDAHVARIIGAFTPEFFQQRKGWGNESEIPVFVVGMPRSGTTLVQQIAASHSHVYGAGELNNISEISHKLLNPSGKYDPSTWTRESLESAAQRHLEFLRGPSKGATRVVDKMPSNLHHLGLITLLFPKARVILCRRDWRDTCLSCYFQNFGTGNIFSYDQADCAHYQLGNHRLMEHWQKIHPLAMLEIEYEKLIADPEPQSRRLIAFLGLPWDPACLEFYRAQTTVLTSSIWQVRQPIYQKSAGRWRHYEQHIRPMLDALGL